MGGQEVELLEDVLLGLALLAGVAFAWWALVDRGKIKK